MAVTVTDNRTTLWQDGVTNINTGTANTTDYAEASGSVSVAINIGTGQIFYNGTMPSSGDFTVAGNELIYVWSSNTATQNSFSAGANSAHAMWVSDGSNDAVVLMAGNDRTAFVHAETQVQFQCFLFDIDYFDEANTASRIHMNSGTVGGFDETSITEVGAWHVTNSKALAGGFNTFLDIIRYGGIEDGIQIAGGTTGARGNFTEVAAADRSKSDGAAHGILREYTANTFGCQGTLRLGITTASTDSFFEATGQSVTWEDRLVDDDKFAVYTDGGTGTNLVILTGCSLSSARPGVLMDFSDTSVNTFTLDGCTFLNTLNAITFGDSTGAETHSVDDCTFNNVGQIDIGTLDSFDGNVITNTNCAASTEGSIYIDNATVDNNMANVTFNNYTSRYAVYISAAVTDGTTLVFDNLQFDGSGTDVYWAGTSGTLTISKTNGSNPSTSASGGGTVTFVGAAVQVTLKAVDATGAVVSGAAAALITNAAGSLPHNASVTISNSGTTATVTHTGHGLATSDKVNIAGADTTDNLSIHVITVTNANTYTFTTAGTNSGSDTGTITASYVYASGTTNGSGEVVSTARVLPADQLATGSIRKGSSAPYWKPAPLNGTVSSNSDTTFTGVMISDD